MYYSLWTFVAIFEAIGLWYRASDKKGDKQFTGLNSCVCLAPIYQVFAIGKISNPSLIIYFEDA